MPKIWTLEEARAALPTVIPLLQELREVARRLRDTQTPLAGSPTGELGPRRTSVNGHGNATGPSGFENEARRILLALQELGVQVKDVETGLIDFPYLREGEEVLLCYRLGETDIGFWHDQQSGFAGRRPLSEL